MCYNTLAPTYALKPPNGMGYNYTRSNSYTFLYMVLNTCWTKDVFDKKKAREKHVVALLQLILSGHNSLGAGMLCFLGACY